MGTLNSDILIVTVEGGVLLESSGRRPGMLLKHPTSLHPNTELSSHAVKSAEVEKLHSNQVCTQKCILNKYLGRF